MSSTSIIKAEQLRFAWPGSPADIIDIENLLIRAQQHTFIEGASGSGKSSLLNLFTGINPPRSGCLEVLGQDMSELSSQQRDRFRADHLGVIFQQFNLLPYLSVIENVCLPYHFSKARKAAIGDVNAEAAMLLEQLHISKSLHTQAVTALSVGQQQRVSVARALLGNPQIIIADEPTSSLDVKRRDSFMQLLFDQANACQSTVIFVSHDPYLAGHFDQHISMSEINRGIAL